MKNDDFRWRRFPPLQAALYLAVRTLIMVVSMFPSASMRRIGRFVGKLMYVIDAKHRSIAEKNVLRAEGMAKDPRAAGRFVRRCYEHIGLSIVENLMIPRLFATHQIERMVRLEGFDIVRRLLAEGRGVIVVIGHLGNWELGGIAVGATGIPFHSIARPVDNPWFDEYLSRFRTSTGQSIIPKFGAVAEARDVLRRGEVLVVLADQDARKAGIFVPFFGRQASTIKTPALLSIKYRAPIVPVAIYREGKDRHVVRIGEPILPGAHESIEAGVHALTAAFTYALESYIREHPEQWMWLHARWKTKPAGAHDEADAIEAPAPREASPSVPAGHGR